VVASAPAARILGESIDLSRQAQLLAVNLKTTLPPAAAPTASPNK
jgi:hypothetical protein